VAGQNAASFLGLWRRGLAENGLASGSDDAMCVEAIAAHANTALGVPGPMMEIPGIRGRL